MSPAATSLPLPDPPEPDPPATWRKRHIAQGRAILPIDLRIRPAVAAIASALLAMLFSPDIPRDGIIGAMLTQILRAEILEKPGRTYDRLRRHGNRRKGKAKGKGNTHAQYQRKRRRRAEARQRHPD